MPELAAYGILLRNWDDLTDAQREEASAYFDNNVSAAVTPLVINPEHPFPFLSNLSTSLTFRLEDPDRCEQMVARIKVPSGLKQWVPLCAGLCSRAAPAGSAARGDSGEHREAVQRDGDLRDDASPHHQRCASGFGEDSPAEIRAQVKEQVRQRRYEPVVRLEFGKGADPDICQMLRERFQLSAADVYEVDGEVDYTTLFEIAGLPIPELRDSPWTPLLPPALEEGSIFSAIQTGDLLVHHPYESFDATAERFISVAADDPDTVAIKMTAYRIGDDTPFVKSLIRAAEQGKQVCVGLRIR